MNPRTLCGIWCLLIAPAASAQVAGDSQELGANRSDEVLVQGIRDPFSLTWKQLQGALEEFGRWRASLSPAGRLQFRVGAMGGTSYDGLRFSLVSGDETIPVQVDPDHRLTLPELPTGRPWTLVANRPRRTILLLPIVLSPGTSDGLRRMGDLRLQCRVEWGLERSEASIVTRGLFGASGGCQGGRFGYYVLAGRPLISATIEVEGGTTALPVVNARSYRAPIERKDVPDEARLRLVYAR